AWHHCVIVPRGDRYRVVDRHTGCGTYVNGMRINEHLLEPGDQISICETVLVYREDPAAIAESPQNTLMRACSLIFLFRAFAEAPPGEYRERLEAQILRLIGDLAPCVGGAAGLGRGAEELRAASLESPGRMQLAGLIDRVRRDGLAIEEDGLAMALGLYVRGELAGVLGARFPESEAANLAEHRDTLSAVASLASAALEGARDVERLKMENALLRERLDAPGAGIVGDCTATRKVLEMVSRVAPRESSVLILGESGTGKELVARALHAGSPRASRPFVAINCAALTETLLESELFGHEKGAFTGAVAQKKGKLEVAEGGTVFLDEAGEM